MALSLAFSAFFAGCKPARMPLIVFEMRGAKPAATRIAENRGRFVARLVQVGDRFTRRFSFLTWILAGRFRFHDVTRRAILLPTGKSRNSSAAGAILAYRLVDQRVQFSAREPHVIAVVVCVRGDRQFRAAARRGRNEIA